MSYDDYDEPTVRSRVPESEDPWYLYADYSDQELDSLEDKVDREPINDDDPCGGARQQWKQRQKNAIREARRRRHQRRGDKDKDKDTQRTRTRTRREPVPEHEESEPDYPDVRGGNGRKKCSNCKLILCIALVVLTITAAVLIIATTAKLIQWPFPGPVVPAAIVNVTSHVTNMTNPAMNQTQEQPSPIFNFTLPAITPLFNTTITNPLNVTNVAPALGFNITEPSHIINNNNNITTPPSGGGVTPAPAPTPTPVPIPTPDKEKCNNSCSISIMIDADKVIVKDGSTDDHGKYEQQNKD